MTPSRRGLILGAGAANREMASEAMMPWRNNPVKNISPFFIYADHRADTRSYTAKLIEVAKAHGVTFETAEHSAHSWPIGESYDRASAFIDRHLKVDY